MRRSFRKVLALLLCFAVMISASGFASAFSASVEHDRGVGHAVGGQSDEGERSGACQHGCAGHLLGHLVSVTSNDTCYGVPAFNLEPQVRQRQQVPPARSFVDSLFRPPRFLLA